MQKISAALHRLSRLLFIAAIALFVGAYQFQLASFAGTGTDATDVEVNRLGEQLKSDDPDERTAALLKLPALGSRVQPLLPRLLELLADDKQTQVGNSRAAISYHDINILRNLGPIVTDTMIKGLHDPKKPIRMGAAEVLGSLQDPKAVEPLVKLLGDEDRELAGRAANSLENLGDLSVDAVIAATKSDKVQVRYIAASALGNIQLPRVVHPLAGLLSDPEKFPRENAAESLGNLSYGHPNSGWNPANKIADEATADRVRAENHAEIRKAIVDELISTLRGNNSDARLAALKASFRVINSEGHQADPRAGELCSTLTNCLADADPEIRKQAVGVIMQINHPDVMPPLVAALRDSNADVRAAAANGLRYRLDTFHEYDDAKFVEPLTAALSDADKRVRTSAAEALGHIHSKSKSSAAPQLAKLLSDPEPEVVTAAIQALVTMGSAVAANPIATLLDHPKLRAQAAIALADMNDSRAIVVLREELANKNTNAIDALGLLNDRDSVEPLIKLLDDNNVDVFRSAAGALGTIGDPRAIKPMIQAARASEGWRQFGMPGGRSKPSNNPVIWPLAHLGFQAIEPLAEALKDPSQTVREVAACALYEMRYNSDTCDKEDLQPAAEALAAALTDPSESVRNYAAIALAHLGDSRAADTLINVVAAADQTELLYFNAGSYLSELHAPRTFEPLLRLLNDPRPEVRSTATRALIGFHDPQAIEPLVTLLSDPAPMVREAAARALGFNKAEQAVGVLFILLADGDASVRIAAAEALGRIGQAKAIEPLANLLDEQDVRLRAAAGVALVRLNDPRGLDAITICLNSGDSQKREMAVTTICFTFPKCEALAKPLAAALNDPSVRVRMYAAGALGRIGNHEAVDALLAKLDDRENIRAILEGLGESKDDRAFAPIAHHLDDADPQNRIWAAAALANFPAEKSAGPLLEHLNEPSPEARLAIIDALATIQAESAADQLKALANDSDPKIRSHAARALSRMKK